MSAVWARTSPTIASARGRVAEVTESVLAIAAAPDGNGVAIGSWALAALMSGPSGSAQTLQLVRRQIGRASCRERV